MLCSFLIPENNLKLHSEPELLFIIQNINIIYTYHFHSLYELFMLKKKNITNLHISIHICMFFNSIYNISMGLWERIKIHLIFLLSILVLYIIYTVNITN